MSGERKHKVVIVGGGFAGMRVVRGLRRAPVAVTLIDRQNFTLFQPLVYQVATGALSPAEIAIPHRALLRRQANARVLLAEVVGFDLEAREVVAEGRAGVTQTLRVGYDTLVVAAGAHYSYFGHEKWRVHAPELKSLDGAVDIRDRVFSAFEAAELSDDEQLRREWLTFVVVGGGPTGVEMAGQIAELGHDALPRDFRNASTEQTRVLLVEANDRLLAAFPSKLSSKAKRSLEQLGVTPLVAHAVVDVYGSGVAIRRPDGATQRVGARTVIWAAGVAASGLAALLAEAADIEPDRAGRIPVQSDFSLPFHPEVLAIGDMAHEMPVPLPGLAPVAIQEGRWVARAIRARLRNREPRPFRYRDKGNLATIGRLHAVADVKGVHLAGFPAWALWLLIHLFYLAGFQNRVLVVLRWTISFLTRGRGARLIVTATEPAGTPVERREAA
jgi:NADH:quinone reductase (non-electrogenic)